MTYIEKYIKEQGPILSSDLIAYLISKEPQITNEAARKRMSRLHPDIFKLKGVFADKQILYYHKDCFGSEEYYNGLVNGIAKAGKQYNAILKSLNFHNGFINQAEIANYCNNPIQKVKGHLMAQTVIEKLKQLSLIREDGSNIALSHSLHGTSNNKHAEGLAIVKKLVLEQFNQWSRNIGLVSFNTVTFHGPFGGYQFNFVSPSYIGTVTKRNAIGNIIPGFVVADILIGGGVDDESVEFFINKIKALKQQKHLPIFIPILVVNSLELSTLKLLKSNGVMIGLTDELFGDGYADLLNSLVNLITNAGAILKTNPDEYLNIIERLDKLVKGKTFNLKGDLFELAVGYYHSRFCRNIDIGKRIISNVEKEIDVYALYDDKIVISECKGRNYKVSVSEAKDWLNETIPAIRKWIIDQPSLSDKKIVFEFWSTSGFDEDALSLMKARKVSSKNKYHLEMYDLDRMIIKSKEIKSKKFTEILKKYYTADL